MSISHIQKTCCYCCECKEAIIISEYIVSGGSDFLKIDPTVYGWKRFVLRDGMYWLCPKHDLDVHVFIDGKTFEIQPREYLEEDYKPDMSKAVAGAMTRY